MNSQGKLNTGQLLGPFKIISLLGEGGMGEVYEALEIPLDRPVALKVVSSAKVSTPQLQERFHREARALAKINHPNVVTVYTFGQIKDVHYLSMELVRGQNLKLQTQLSVFTLSELYSFFQQLVQGLAAIHSNQLIHRDIKPSNILLLQDGTVKITDFGLALHQNDDFSSGLTSTGQILGTMAYLSPDTLKDGSFSQQTDIYALGLVFFELICGFNPFQGKNNFETAENIRLKPAQLPADLRPLLPKELILLVEKMLAKNPAQRFLSANSVRSELQKLPRTLPIGIEIKESDLYIANREEVGQSLKAEGCVYPFEKSTLASMALEGATAAFDPDATASGNMFPSHQRRKTVIRPDQLAEAACALRAKFPPETAQIKVDQTPTHRAPAKPQDSAPSLALVTGSINVAKSKAKNQRAEADIELAVQPEEVAPYRPRPKAKEVKLEIEDPFDATKDEEKIKSEMGIFGRLKKMFGGNK